MNSKLFGLIAIALMTTLLFWRPGADVEQVPLLFPTLKPDLAKVDQLSLRRADKELPQVTIHRVGDDWLLAEKSSYPTDVASVRTFLQDLAQVKLIERKTSKTKFHALLGLADTSVDSIEAEDNEDIATLVSIGWEDGSFDVLIGRSVSNRGSFVRYPGQAQTYLANLVLDAPTGVDDWLDKVVVDIEAEKIQRIEVRVPGLERLIAERAGDDATLTLVDLPVGATLAYPTVVDSMARMLSNLRFLDVAPIAVDQFQGATKTLFSLQDGRLITAQTIQHGDTYWLHLYATDNNTDMNQENGSSLDPMVKPTLDQWQYQISEFSYNEFNKTLPDMLATPDTD